MFIVLIYLLFFSQNRYVSESTIIVKQVGEINTQIDVGVGALLGVNNTNGEDAEILKAYIQSRDMVEQLDRSLNLTAAFYHQGKDPFFGLEEEPSKERLVRYYQDRIKVKLDDTTKLLTISSEGFTPEFALKLNQTILLESEKFINDISQKIAKDQLVFANKQLIEASDNLSNARENLINYQNKNRMYDPQAQAASVAQIAAQLESTLTRLQTEERTLLSYLNPTAPQVVALRSQIDSVKKQIQDEKSKLTSSKNSKKLNRDTVDFQTLKSNVEFAVDLYQVALASFEKARLEAARKLKNVVVITNPGLPEDAQYPKYTYIVLSVFILLNLLFGIVMLASSVIREHKE